MRHTRELIVNLREVAEKMAPIADTPPQARPST